MARKLKSDTVLFLATLLLVLASVVMVYSASAAMADVRFGNPYLFLVKQGMWAALEQAGVRPSSVDLAALRERAEDQRRRIESGRLAIAAAVLELGTGSRAQPPPDRTP